MWGGVRVVVLNGYNRSWNNRWDSYNTIQAHNFKLITSTSKEITDTKHKKYMHHIPFSIALHQTKQPLLYVYGIISSVNTCL